MASDNDNLSFGKRFGLVPVEIPFQTNEIDQTLRTNLWNAHYIFIQKPIEDSADRYNSFNTINKLLWVHFFNKPLDDFPQYNSQFGSFVRKYIEKELWYKVYEFFEFLFRNKQEEHVFEYTKFEEYLNSKLRSNSSAYTLSCNKFIPITNKTEVSEIKKTQELSKNYSLGGIQQHLNSSLELLSQKPTPDFRNSIKESISMVEVISRIIEPTENTLGKALNKLDKKGKINGTLKAGFEKLYAYTNDKNGIRHALMEDQNTDIEDAKFFLISCSAFTNYLIEKAIKENLIKNTH